jgi:hypothetical protein
MGSDVWTDEVRGFYFEIAPEQFPLLLAGRDFRLLDFGMPFETKTIHVKPAVTFMARWKYKLAKDLLARSYLPAPAPLTARRYGSRIIRTCGAC